jgi:hypothetical protein
MSALSCDAAVVLASPSAASELGPNVRWQDLMDLILHDLMQSSTPDSIALEVIGGRLFDVTVAWYKKFYGFDMEKQVSETWQEWEIRVTKFFGLSLVKVYLSRSPSDIVVSREPGAQIINVGTLDKDIRNSLVPYLDSLPVMRNKPQPLPEYRRLFKVSRLLLAGSRPIVYALEMGFEMNDRVRDTSGRALRRIKSWF